MELDEPQPVKKRRMQIREVVMKEYCKADAGCQLTLVGKKDPTVVFLMETKSKNEGIEKVCRKIQFAHKFAIPRPNKGGGLALLWKEDI